jgi:hypothetical protein
MQLDNDSDFTASLLTLIQVVVLFILDLVSLHSPLAVVYVLHVTALNFPA